MTLADRSPIRTNYRAIARASERLAETRRGLRFATFLLRHRVGGTHPPVSIGLLTNAAARALVPC